MFIGTCQNHQSKTEITNYKILLFGLTSLAARKLIQLLQDREENNGDVKKEIIQLGCRYGKKKQ